MNNIFSFIVVKGKASDSDGKFSEALELHEIKNNNTKYLNNLEIIKDSKLQIAISHLLNYTL